MNCIKCGRPIPDGELFCVECSLAPPAREGASAHPAAPAPAHDAAQEPAPARRPVGLIVALVLALALAAGETVWLIRDLTQNNTQSAALTRANTELAQSNSRISTLEDELARTDEALTASELTADELRAEIDALELQLGTAAGSATQSRFDLTEQQSEYAELVAQFEELSARTEQLEQDLADTQEALADAQADLSESQSTLTALRAENAGLSEKVSFFDTYAVFVTVDDPTYYHHYGCSEVGSRDYWIYNRKLAESKGSTPCPLCCH